MSLVKFITHGMPKSSLFLIIYAYISSHIFYRKRSYPTPYGISSENTHILFFNLP